MDKTSSRINTLQELAAEDDGKPWKSSNSKVYFEEQSSDSNYSDAYSVEVTIPLNKDQSGKITCLHVNKNYFDSLYYALYCSQKNQKMKTLNLQSFQWY